MSYDSVVQWCLHTAVSEFFRGAQWRLASLEIVHLVGLLVWFSTVLVVDLRLLGRILVRQPAAEIAADVAPFGLAALIAQGITGPMLFLATVVKSAMSISLGVKLTLLAIALTYHFSIHRRAIRSAGLSNGMPVRTIAGFSLALWFGVALAGLWIDI
jgi:hypothetical protein